MIGLAVQKSGVSEDAISLARKVQAELESLARSEFRVVPTKYPTRSESEDAGRVLALALEQDEGTSVYIHELTLPEPRRTVFSIEAAKSSGGKLLCLATAIALARVHHSTVEDGGGTFFESDEADAEEVSRVLRDALKGLQRDQLLLRIPALLPLKL